MEAQTHYRARGGEWEQLSLTVYLCVPTALSSTNKWDIKPVNLSLERQYSFFAEQSVPVCVFQVFQRGCDYA